MPMCHLLTGQHKKSIPLFIACSRLSEHAYCKARSGRLTATIVCRFLNTVLHLAHGAEPKTGGWDEWGNLIKHHHRQAHMHTMPNDKTRAPDLVVFGPANYGEKWHETQARCLLITGAADSCAASLEQLRGHVPAHHGFAASCGACKLTASHCQL